ncbi:lipopolysaccharide biosynthesis protein [Oleiagrimonas citrea]|uniref:Lipopolysaccharide biosynthesis protein n=1 Tax=Oleiagrimonas citrea TaxID=1665687 RepID=A0A846ZQG9_9GAMM|nr:lipopolysaccharide biosynthesis protein [Oleiagrimonas citrea]NKZ39661.1 lipopolysaccharide biosynthesis protein [Oleiagrimonas citrea]
MAELEQRATHATWWSALEILARYGMQLCVMIVLARVLSPADFGLIAMLLVFTSIGALLVDSGFGTALIQRRDITLDDETTVFTFAITSAWILALVLWFTAPAIADFYRQPKLVSLTHLMVFLLPLGALAAVPDALLTRRLDFASRARAEVFASFIAGAAAIALAMAGFGVWSMAWQAVIALGLRAVLLARYARWIPQGRFTRTAFRKLFGFGGYMLLARLLDMAYVRLQALLLGRFFDASTLGYYTLAQNTEQAPSSFIGSLLNRVGLPVFSEVAEKPKQLRDALRQSLRVSSFLFMPCMIGLALIARPLIELVYGTRWVNAAPILSLLALASALWPLHVLNLAALAASGRSDLLFRQEAIKKLFAIGMVTAASPFGPLAVAGAVLASSLLSAFINTWYIRRLLDYGLLKQLSDQGRTIAGCIVSAIAGSLLLHYLPSTPWIVSGTILIAGLLYLIVARWLNNPAWKAMLRILDNLRHHTSPHAHE